MSDNPPLSDPSAPLGGADPRGASAPPTADGSGATSGESGWKSWVIAGVVAAVIAVGAVVALDGKDSSASDPGDASTVQTNNGSQPQGPGGTRGPGRGTTGTVGSVDGDTISVRNDSGETVEVTANSDTQVAEIAEGTITDLAVGDNILAIGETGTDGVVAAQSITNSGDQEPAGAGPGGRGFTPPEGMEFPEGGQPPAGMSIPEGMETPGGNGQARPGSFTPPTAGAITAIDGSNVTVETAEGKSVMVTVGDDTTITVSSVIDVADIDEGDSVVVEGEVDDGAVTATSIRVGDPELLTSGFGGRPGGPRGTGQPGADTPTTTN